MKTVLYNVLFIFIIPMVFTRCEKEPDPITIPDDNFLKALIELGVDTNGDGVISPAEAAIITYLSVYNNISDMTGIEAFVNLDTLYCPFNQLTSLDVSKNTLLIFLDCRGNKLFSLDVSKNTVLEKLRCYSNQLTSLDVSNNTRLSTLSCSKIQLTSLDISNNNSIIILDIENMPSLYEVCVWEMPFPPAGVDVYTGGSPNVYFTTECSS